MLRGAASSGEPALCELWARGDEQCLVAARRFDDALATKVHLRPGVDYAAATDVAWLHTALENYHPLVNGRRWSTARYQRWLVETLAHAPLSAR